VVEALESIIQMSAASTSSDSNSIDTHESDVLIPFAGGVGGHDGIMSTLNEALIIKPCNCVERSFYEALATSSMAFYHDKEVDMEAGGQIAAGSTNLSRSPSPFEALCPWIPRFYGTLRLEGRVDPSDPARLLPVDGSDTRNVE
jgi:hypothetical protein